MRQTKARPPELARTLCPHRNEIQASEWIEGFIHGLNGGIRQYISTTEYEDGRNAGITWAIMTTIAPC